jgi:hypothetical protein
VMRKLGMIVERAPCPRPPDLYVVGVLTNPHQQSHQMRGTP